MYITWIAWMYEYALTVCQHRNINVNIIIDPHLGRDWIKVKSDTFHLNVSMCTLYVDVDGFGNVIGYTVWQAYYDRM